MGDLRRRQGRTEPSALNGANIIGLDHELQFDSHHRIFRLVFHNDLTEASYLAGYSAGRAFLKANQAEGVILDFSDIRDFGLSSSFIRMIADLPEVTNMPRVVVAPQKVVFGTVRMFQLLRESNATGYPALVESLPDALKLLGFDSLEFTPVPPGTFKAGSPNSP
jgi:hypothetical protein